MSAGSGPSELPTPTAPHPPTARHIPVLNPLSLNSPQTRRFQVPQSSMPSPRYPASARREDLILSPTIPSSADAKRRRFNQPQYIPTASRFGGPSTPYFLNQSAQRSPSIASLPHPDPRVRNRQSISLMGPPPFHPGSNNGDGSIMSPRTIQSPRLPNSPRASRGPSMSLPPLQIGDRDQRRSVAAIVMDMHYFGKIKILRRIAPPLKQPTPSSPALDVRGAVIAVEGDNADAVHAMVRWLKDEFARTGEIAPRVDDSPLAPNGEASLQEYLGLMASWQEKSREMIKFITTAPQPDHDECDKEGPNSPMEVDHEKEQTQSVTSTSSSSPKSPVILIPNYQFHSSNVYACAIPITDAYSPGDHWQWMATLWRGIVGPDITIYVRDSAAEDMDKEDLVDRREDIKTLIVRRKKGMEIEERALRRVGFEVGEWVRAIKGKAGKKGI